ncbi:SMI1/KNR4 family protein [Myxococcus sp. MISCRS1]|uniref:SMI1/KNR4 family protein n=1 Tax=Myxococcus TaxID=32 RepID=UPI0020C03E7F|nr:MULTISPECIES: SMI1/KNR4 family protein [Myxococcus]MCK8500116.1 SMI1/KNR4 family protein [Myxococcus fulvus]MCY0997583.1 SMI1/KNR4 family protein [Myxococcus sp. MISCRS1]
MKQVSQSIEALKQSKLLELTLSEPISADALVKAVKPHFGTLRWTPPPSYREALALGLCIAERNLQADGLDVGFWLYDAEDIASANEDLVHLPEGVSIEEGVDLSTNHLVGFAEAGGEAVWCFDVSKPGPNGEYPIYYHHQDQPRARVLATGAWHNPEDATPDFESFPQWLETMTAALTAPKPPSWFKDVGAPGMTFADKRLSL